MAAVRDKQNKTKKDTIGSLYDTAHSGNFSLKY